MLYLKRTFVFPLHLFYLLNILLTLLTFVMLTGCVNLSNAAPTKPTLLSFTTDGCSLFPNGSVSHPQAWCHCCVAHDKVYWRGGTLEERRAADVALKECVQQTGYANIARLMWLGVSVAGGPQLNTTFRWGYGWPYLRPYQELTTEEATMAKVLMMKYEHEHEHEHEDKQ